MSFWLLSGSPSAALATEPAPPVVPPEPAAPFVPVAEPRAKETPPQGGSTDKEEEEEAQPPATTNLNSAKAEAKLIKALDYLVAINDNSDNPAQKWVINVSIQSLLNWLLQAGYKEIRRKPSAPLLVRLTTPTTGARPGPIQTLSLSWLKGTPWASRSNSYMLNWISY